MANPENPDNRQLTDHEVLEGHGIVHGGGAAGYGLAYETNGLSTADTVAVHNRNQQALHDHIREQEEEVSGADTTTTATAQGAQAGSNGDAEFLAINGQLNYDRDLNAEANMAAAREELEYLIDGYGVLTYAEMEMIQKEYGVTSDYMNELLKEMDVTPVNEISAADEYMPLVDQPKPGEVNVPKDLPTLEVAEIPAEYRDQPAQNDDPARDNRFDIYSPTNSMMNMVS